MACDRRACGPFRGIRFWAGISQAYDSSVSSAKMKSFTSNRRAPAGCVVLTLRCRNASHQDTEMTTPLSHLLFVISCSQKSSSFEA